MKYKEIMEQYAAKGCNMALDEALHYITALYMDQCGISASLRTVIYESGEMLFDLLLEDANWKDKIGEDIYLFKAMYHFHSEYTKSYEKYDIIYLSYQDCEECCDMVIEEQCSSINSEQQVAVPYNDNGEQKLQAFCRGALLMLRSKKEIEEQINGK